MNQSAIPFSLTLQGNPGAKVLRSRLKPGLYTLIVSGDASRFNWDELYVTLDCYGNVNERTGPWDFNLLENNRPVLPAYWVWLDGRKLGLWYFNRPSARQIEEKRFQGEMCFLIRDEGEHEIRFDPYREFDMSWDGVALELERHDRWIAAEPLSRDILGEVLPAAMPENRFTAGFIESVRWAKGQVHTGRNSGFQIPILAAAWRWLKDEEALVAARKVIEAFVAQPVWNNPREDGYGHNGDMGAATPLFGLAVGLRWLERELEDLREPLLEKLRRQGNIFLEMALLHRGYWGGSILQDHGFVSFAWFACAAYALQEILPDAREWLGFARHRMGRTLDVLPRDGVVPGSSYHELWMYVDKLVLYRELHRRATGEDIYAQECIRAIPSAARARYVEETGGFAYPSPRGDSGFFDGAQAFLAQLGEDPDAHWLLDRFFEKRNLTRQRPPYNEAHFQKDWLWAMLFANRSPNVPASAFHAPDVRVVGSAGGVQTRWFGDSGVGVVRGGGSVLVGLASPMGAVAGRPEVTCPCDRGCFAPLAGNFVWFHQGRKILHTAEGGYRMSGEVGNLLFVNGKGQKGDAGMPMGHPDAESHGEKLSKLWEDGSGFVLDLAGAYEGVDLYRRSWRLAPEGGLLLEDEVQLAKAGLLGWRFQSYRRNPWESRGAGRWRLTVDGVSYQVSIALDGVGMVSVISPTKTVWGYVSSNENEACNHLAITTEKPVPRAVLRLAIAPES